MTYLSQSIDTDSQWPQRVVDTIQNFPERPEFTNTTLGAPVDRANQELWHA